MEITALNSANSNAAFSNAKRNESVAAVAAPKAQNAEKDPLVGQQQVKDVQKTEKDRLETVMRASKTYANIFAAGDTKFTIFKDSSGQFVTRFTNLRDGSVTYIPEPDVVRYMDAASERRAALFEVEA